MKMYESQQEGNWELKYLEAFHKGTYMMHVASIFGDVLQNSIRILVEELHNAVELCDKYRLGFMDIPDDIEEFRKLLQLSADESQKQNPKRLEAVKKVVTEATRLKAFGLKIDKDGRN